MGCVTTDARCLLPIVALVGLTACATADADRPDREENPDQITLSDIRALPNPPHAYSVVERLRPFWLQRRGRGSFEGPDEAVLYLDGQQMGGPEELRYVNVADVPTISYLDARLSNLRFVAGHTQGAILVATRDGSRLGR